MSHESYLNRTEKEAESEAARLPDRKGEFVVVKTEFDGIIDWKFDAKKLCFQPIFNKAWSKRQILNRTVVQMIGPVYSTYRQAVQRAIIERETGGGSEWFEDGDDFWAKGPPYDSRDRKNTCNETEYLIRVIQKSKYLKEEEERLAKLDALERGDESKFEQPKAKRSKTEK